MILKEIAHLANVSEAAVSIALNNKKGVSDKTREKILRIAKEHGYESKRTKEQKERNNQRNIR